MYFRFRTSPPFFRKSVFFTGEMCHIEESWDGHAANSALPLSLSYSQGGVASRESLGVAVSLRSLTSHLGLFTGEGNPVTFRNLAK